MDESKDKPKDTPRPEDTPAASDTTPVEAPKAETPAINDVKVSVPTAQVNGHIDPEALNSDAPKVEETAPAAAQVPEITDASSTGKDNFASDPDAQAMVITSLRSQIQDLYSQVTQLNTKLVQSYDRVSDLEDDLHMTSSTLRSSSLKVSQLELERTQHLSALNTGLLVERTQVVAELTRLMEKATEEAAQRGQAETARKDIEKDLDDLSASLFGQANSMVAEARYAQALSERKVDEAQLALKGAEEVVGIMQHQLQSLQAQKEEADANAEELRLVMGKGKWVDRHLHHENSSPSHPLRLMSSHLPYQDFLMFVTHLRSMHPTQVHPPAISTLLSLPFLARLMLEDSDPTVRIDLAPSLNWLSRRSVVAAIHSGQLTIEPMPSTTLLQETAASSPLISGINSSSNNVSCALCGTPVFPSAPHVRRPSHPVHSNSQSQSTWSAASLFKIPLSYGTPTGSPPSTPIHEQTPSQPLPSTQAQIYIFRLAPAPTTPAVPLITGSPSKSNGYMSPYNPAYPGPSQSQHHNTQPRAVAATPASSTIYPLCTSGWCLTRLRTTCSLWAFVRTGVVDKIWDEELIQPKPTAARRESTSSLSRVSSHETPSQPAKAAPTSAKPPPIPPRRKSLWGLASAFGEKAVSWTEEKITPPTPTPAPAPAPVVMEEPKSLSPAPGPPLFDAGAALPPPPPLPRRAEGRGRTGTGPSRVASPAPPIVEEPVVEKSDAPPPPPVLPPRRDTSNVESFSTPAEEIAVNPLVEEVAKPIPNDGGTKPEEAAVDVVDSEKPSDDPKSTETMEEKTPVEGDEVEKSKPDLEKRAVEVETAAPSPVIAQAQEANLPSRTGSPAPPPPLPRRAAARVARPISVVVAPEVKPIDPEVTAGSVVLEDSEAPDIVEEKDNVVNEAVVVEAPQPDKTEDKPEAAAEKPGEAEEEKLETEVVPTPKVEAALDTEEPNLVTEEPTPTESSQAVVASPPPRTPTPKLDPAIHITSATWEERTWKELVRLREEMFWARVGGVKTPVV